MADVELTSVVPIPAGFVSVEPAHAVDEHDDVETILVRIPAGVTPESLAGAELPWTLEAGASVTLTRPAASSSKRSKKAAPVDPAAPRLVFDAKLVPEAANMVALVSHGTGDSFRAHPIKHVAALVTPFNIPTETIESTGAAVKAAPYVPRAQPDMPHRPAFEIFAAKGSSAAAAPAAPAKKAKKSKRAAAAESPASSEAAPAAKRAAEEDAEAESAKPAKKKKSSSSKKSKADA
ncbi:hypothetical protein H9P43_001409 [Blastocladiella emersonii ATCC 22665]|nr:hypothetical protein H9P43_001409 [Blastocladiella emersonii ATCC 22665]